MTTRRGLALSPECRLVFLSAGPAGNDAQIERLARGPVDWERTLAIAHRENAVASVWKALERRAPDAPPSDVADHLRKFSLVSDFRMLHLANRLAATLRVLHGRRIDTLLLKGAALGASTYPSFAERPMVDVDLLVRRADTARAHTALVDAGWPQSQDPVLADLLDGHHHLPPFIDADATGLRIELHTSILADSHPFRLSDDEIWSASVEARGEFAGARVPAPHHLMLHACVHFSWSHVMTFGAWRTFRDVRALAESGRMDWDRFVAAAQESRAASSCYWVFRLADRLSGIEVPAEVVRAVRPPGTEYVRRVLERHFITSIALGEGPQCPSVRLSRELWRMAIRPRWSGHGGRIPGEGGKNWEMAFTGVLPDTTSRRFVRHLTSARAWLSYLAYALNAAR